MDNQESQVGVSSAADYRNAISVDVEDYFQVSAFENVIERSDWRDHRLRVEQNTFSLLDLFAELDVRATFFTLGWVAERAPNVIKAVVERGHELGSHGYDHTRVTQMDEEKFRQDVLRTKQILEDIGGEQVVGYRAPTFSIDQSTPWALRVLAEAGHKYSSSAHPVNHDMYGTVSSQRFPYIDTESGILEIPVSTIQIAGKTLPCGGGGYFRLYPYTFTRWCFKRINEQESQHGVFYMHPWEIDFEQPTVDGVSLKTRFRHYLNLRKTEKRLRRLLSDFSWGRMDEIFLPKLADGASV